MSRTPFTGLAPAIARPTDHPDHFLLVRESQAKKLGLRADGVIDYQVLLDPARERVFLRVTKNAGSGSFSTEAVAVDKLRACLAHRDASKPLRGSVFQAAIIGKSSCNAGFATAVMVAEGLLSRDPDKRHDLLDVGIWEAWSAEQREAGGDLTEVHLDKGKDAPKADADPGADTSASDEAQTEPDADTGAAQGTARARRKGKDRE